MISLFRPISFFRSLSWTGPGYLLLLFLFSCAKKKQAGPEPMIAKTLPGIILNSSNSLLKFHADTLYYKQGFFSGYCFSLFENGDTSESKGYFNGVEEGVQRKYYPGHILSEERYFINGKKHGPQRTWWPDGQLKMEYTANNNEYEGRFREWNNAHVLIKEFNYSQGLESGRQRLWWDNGKPRANYEVRNGRSFGTIGSKLCMNPNDSIR